jgi:transposase
MAIEKRYSLGQAAKLVGVKASTLKLWLAECAIVLPEVPRGSKVLLRESQVEAVLRKREAKTDWSLIRHPRKLSKKEATAVLSNLQKTVRK